MHANAEGLGFSFFLFFEGGGGGQGGGHNKRAAFPLVSINLTQKKTQDTKLELLHHYLKFHPDQMKSVGENDANRYCFALTS